MHLRQLNRALPPVLSKIFSLKGSSSGDYSKAGKVFLDKEVAVSGQKFLNEYDPALLCEFPEYYNDLKMGVEVFFYLKRLYIYCHFSNRCVQYRVEILGELISFFDSLTIDLPAASERVHIVNTLKRHLKLPPMSNVAFHACVPVSYLNTKINKICKIKSSKQRKELACFLKGKRVVNLFHDYLAPKEIHFN